MITQNPALQADLTDAWAGAVPLREVKGDPQIRLNAPVVNMTLAEAGDLYFAADRSGVFRFDGQQIQRAQGLEQPRITILRFDDQGTLWLGGNELLGRAWPQPDGSYRYQSLLGDLQSDYRPLNQIWFIEPLTEGLLFGDTNRMLHWDGLHWAGLNVETDLRLVLIGSGAQSRICAADGRIWQWRSGAFRRVWDEALRGHIPVMGTDLPDGDFLIRTEEPALLRMSQDAVVSESRGPHILALQEATTVTMVRGRELGVLGYLTFKLGMVLMRPDGQPLAYIDERMGLATRQPNCALRDPRGHLWIGTDNGLQQAQDEGRFWLYRASSNEPIRAVGSLLMQQNTLYVQSLRGLLTVQPEAGPEMASVALVKEGINNQPMIQVDGLAMANDFGQVSIYQEGSKVGAFDWAKTPNLTVSLNDGTGRILSLEREGLRVAKLSPQAITEGPVFGNPYGNVEFVGQQPGRLWLHALGRGLERVDYRVDVQDLAGEVVSRKTYPELSAALDNGKVRLAVDAPAPVLLASHQLWRYAEATDRFTVIPGLENWSFHHHPGKMSRDGTLYLVAESVTGGVPALVALRAAEGVQPEVRVLASGPLPSLRGVTAMLLDTDASGVERLWVGGPEGLMMVRVDELLPQALPDAPRLHRLQVADSPRFGNWRSGVALDWFTGAVRVDYGPADFAVTEPLSYEVRLGGLDKAWRKPSPETHWEVGGLREGRYSFAVRAVGPGGLRSAESQFALVIRPPWFRSPWAYAGYLMLSAGAVAAAFIIRGHFQKMRVRELEALVAQRTAELRAASAAKSNFLATMSHELRNPLNGVVGAAEVLARRLRDPQHGTMVRTLRTCATHLNQMIGDVLDFSRIESGQITLEEAPFDLAELLEEVAALYRVPADQAGKPLRVRLPESAPADRIYFGDAPKLRQVLINFVGNALKYAVHEPIDLSVALEPSYGERWVLRFEVADGGPGIPEADRQKLFERFYRTDSARRGGQQGIGLGLALSLGIARSMGGDLGVAANARGGSTFSLRVELPRSQVAPEHLGVDLDWLRGRRILVVDDMDYNREVLEQQLLDCGARVQVAMNGLSALELLAPGTFEAALLDWDLPDIDGLEIARRHRAAGGRTVLFACTAFSTQEKVQECLNAGMNGFVGKPVTLAKLVRVWQELEPRPSARLPLLDPAPVSSSALGAEPALQTSGKNPPGLTVPASAPEAQALPLQLQVLRLLARGSETAYRQRLQAYREELQQLRTCLSEAQQAGDPATRRRTAHKLLSHLAIVLTGPDLDCLRRLQESDAAFDSDFESAQALLQAVDAQLKA